METCARPPRQGGISGRDSENVARDEPPSTGWCAPDIWTNRDTLREPLGHTGVMRTGTGIALTVFLVAGCSNPATPTALSTQIAKGAPAVSQTSTKAPVAVATPKPTPTLWTKPEAAKAYLAMVAPSNRAVDVFNAAVKTDVSTKIRMACAKMLSTEDKFMRDLDAGQWSADVRPLVEDVIASLASDRNEWLGCSESKTRAELIQALNAPMNDAHAGAAQTLRVRLGLPGTS